MQGTHLTADCQGCPADAPAMTDADAVCALCLREVAAVGLTAVGTLFHRFDAQGEGRGGVTGVVLLAESHLALHTWPELQAVTLDVYVCNLGADNSARAERLMQALIDAFGARTVQRRAIERGVLA